MSTTSSDKSDNSNKGAGKQPFFNASGAIDAFDEATKWFRPYYEPIPEFERIARNRPSDKIDPTLPKITDGTAAGLNQENPKRVIQQLITGIVKCPDHEEYALLADLVHRRIILPNQLNMGSGLQKQWIMMTKAGTWGRAASYSFFTENNGILTVDYVIPYYADLYSEPGKVYAPDSNISHLRSWYQKRDLKAIINREKRFMARDKSYKSDWDLSALAEMMNSSASAKPAEQQTPAEREKGGDVGGFEVIHAFQTGVGAEWYSFAARGGVDGKTRKPLRTKVSNDPRGKMPFDFEYYDLDHSNPMGRGLIERIGGVQNFTDQKLQMGSFMNAMLMGPPLKKWGNVKTSTLKYRPNVIWDMGTNRQTNDVEPYQPNNIALQNFIPDMQFLQSKIYNLAASQDNSIPADSGSVAQSKTSAGVKANEARLGVSDNYLRKQHEEWAQAQMETAINIFFAEMTGTGKIKLDQTELKDFQRNKEASKYLKDDVVHIPYKEINKITFKFEADASSSEIKENADNAEKLTQVYQLMMQDPDPEIQEKKKKVLKVLIDEIGAEGTDDLFAESETDAEGNPIESQAAPAVDPNAILQQIAPVIQQMVQEGIKAQEKPQEDPTLALIKALGLKFDQLPEGARQIVLEHIGMNTEEPTPADEKQDMELLKHLDGQEQAFVSQEQSQKQAEMQQQQSLMQSTASENAPTDAPQQGSGLSDEDETALINALMQLGFEDGDIEQGVTMAHAGHELQEIVNVLGAKYQGAIA